ncbi:hypothetical protein BIFPSEUDO_04479 [Bifidobacterium pseudocatenulatum DSM 20438 = JCM 1200 = LMG 10505]|uniref:Uncharacterized protein n=1 Tax=Bifidobacterium pseudocatenulatum DSM 20438 = JCM 1200 = LMG 10505 TaxID=547043 RepID=C0BVN0_BIFPS|nr:hypothetical protein BIFPSEUDO_04479 [Bifidobacterium pseudocatenulatum DSM 20438 = JCM 1200 = LMG 10505]
MHDSLRAFLGNRMLLKQYQQVSQGNSKDTQVLKFDDFASIGISMPASETSSAKSAGSSTVWTPSSPFISVSMTSSAC